MSIHAVSGQPILAPLSHNQSLFQQSEFSALNTFILNEEVFVQTGKSYTYCLDLALIDGIFREMELDNAQSTIIGGSPSIVDSCFTYTAFDIQTNVVDTVIITVTDDVDLSYTLQFIIHVRLPEELPFLDDFSYSFKRGERIGIIGKNGVGKSTFLKILTGEIEADSGNVDTGETIVFGHFQQKGIEVDEQMRVIDVLKEIASVIQLSDGTQISASQFLEHFLFTPEMQYTPVEKLSGGEKRRLGLMMTLIKNPNFLILDEPTNDLDLDTLQILEDFLMSFGGCLIVVSHDRFFMDKLVDHYFAFEGDGVIRDHHGTYSEYRELKEKEETKHKRQVQAQKSEKKKTNYQNRQSSTSNKLTFAERKEFKKLEREVAELEKKVESLEEEMNHPGIDYKEREEMSDKYLQLKDHVDEKTMRWLELAEKEG